MHSQANCSEIQALHEKSKQHLIDGDLEEAIHDASKTIILECSKNYRTYLNRSQMFLCMGKFQETLDDYRTACNILRNQAMSCKVSVSDRSSGPQLLYKSSIEGISNSQLQFHFQHYLKQSPCIRDMEQVEYMIKDYQTCKVHLKNREHCDSILTDLLTIPREGNIKGKEALKVQLEDQEKESMMKQMKKELMEMYEDDMKKMKKEMEEELKQKFKEEYLRHQAQLQEFRRIHKEEIMEQLKHTIKEECLINYEATLRNKLQESTISILNKKKLLLYYSELVSQLQKIYLVAKCLNQFDQKVSQSILENRDPKSIICKLYSYYDKYKSKIQRFDKVITFVPGVHEAFKIMTTVMKFVGIAQLALHQNQYSAITSIASDCTMFSQWASRLAYQLIIGQNGRETPIKYKVILSSDEHFRKSLREKLAKTLISLRQENLADLIDEDSWKREIISMAKMHSTVIMIAIANKQIESQDVYSQKVQKIEKLLQKVQQKLVQQKKDIKLESAYQKQQQKQSRCCIY